jgi:TPR repeat protein
VSENAEPEKKSNARWILAGVVFFLFWALVVVLPDWQWKDPSHRFFNEARMRAEAGDPHHQHKMARYLMKGDDELELAADPEKARMWLERAARKNHAPSLFDLAQMLERGEGGPEDAERALDLYVRSADAGSPVAANHLGGLYRKGKGVEVNLEKARGWYLRAARKKNRESLFALGLMMARGEGGDVDYVAAKEWYEEAAQRGHPVAAFNLGIMFEAGQGGAPDPVRALACFEQASGVFGHASATARRDALVQKLTEDQRAKAASTRCAPELKAR